MYYRRKYLLALLEAFGGQLSKIAFHKLLFLATQAQKQKLYSFIPSTYGCYSFTANQDLSTLAKYGEVISKNIKDHTCWIKAGFTPYRDLLKIDDRLSIESVVRNFSSFSQQDLIQYTYINHPWFAINSVIAVQILSKEENEKIESQRRTIKKKAVFSLGYEGESLESFLNKLIINDIKTLIDVRKNALSMKFGFSKSQIANACKLVHIKYMHLPELGIHSEKRKVLKDFSDYKRLLDGYEKETLPEASGSLQIITHEIEKENRVSLMCFEKDPSWCHRSRIMKALSGSLSEHIQIRNLQ